MIRWHVAIVREASLLEPNFPSKIQASGVTGRTLKGAHREDCHKCNDCDMRSVALLRCGIPGKHSEEHFVVLKIDLASD